MRVAQRGSKSADEAVAAIVRDLRRDADIAEASNPFDMAVTTLRDKATEIERRVGAISADSSG